MMRFAQPGWLLLLLLIPVLAWLRGRMGREAAFVYSSVQLVRGVSASARSSVGAWLMRMRWLALATLIVGLARPQLTFGESRIRASGIDIVVALDLSGSMAAEDFELQGKRVNRLVIAKDVLLKFIQRRENDRIGLVAFSGRAYIAAPLTLDHAFLLQNLERLDLGQIDDGTAIGSALVAAVNRLRDLQSKSKVVVLMTDGVSNAGKVPPLTAAETAQALGVKVYTIGVGTRGTAPFPQTDMFGTKRYVPVPVEIDEDTMKKIADKTGGRYYRADNTDTLRAVYDEIDKLERTEVEVKRFQRYEEFYPWFVVPGLAILLLEMILANTVWRRLP